MRPTMALDHTPETRPSLHTLEQRGDFIRRHIGPDPRQIGDMLGTLRLATRDRYKRPTPGRIIGARWTCSEGAMPTMSHSARTRDQDRRRRRRHGTP